jgi:hypothetical protein
MADNRDMFDDHARPMMMMVVVMVMAMMRTAPEKPQEPASRIRR